MKKMKRLSIFLLIGILIFSLFAPACGGANTGDNSTSSSNTETPPASGRVLCTLQETYDNGWLTEEDLKTAAEYHANKMNCPEPIDEVREANMFETYAEALNEKHSTSEYSADEINLYRYYGTYNHCSIAMMIPKGTYFKDVELPTTIRVAGAEFYFIYYKYAEYLFAYYEI